MYASTSASQASFWWDHPPGFDRVHDDLVPYCRWLIGVYRVAHQIDRGYERIYENPVMRAYGGAVALLSSRYGVDAARLNVAKAVVDTVHARLIKRRAMPAFRVEDAQWDLKQRAKDARKFLVGKMMESEFDELSPEALLDGCVVGSGITGITDGDDDVIAERVFRDELLIDPRECTYGRPWQVQRIRRIARVVLAERFRKHKEAIMHAPPSLRRPHESLDDPEYQLGSNSLEDYVDVYEAHRRPTGTDSDDGRYALVIDGATILFEEWESPRFPYALFRYQRPRRGFWGRGLIHDVQDMQHRINLIVRDIQMNLSVTGLGSYMVNEAYDVPVEMLTGRAPFKLKWKGPPGMAPQWNAPNPVSVQSIQLLDKFINWCFELPGVSQAFASSKSSVGLDASGVARDTQYEIESERLSSPENNYARYRLDAAQLYLDAATRVAKNRYQSEGEKRSYTATWNSGDAIERLEFQDVEMDEGSFKLQLEPVNFIPDTRAGKLSTVQELTAAGIIPQWLAASLYDEPDLQKANRINLGAYKNLERIMDQLMKKKIQYQDLMPEPYHDLKLGEVMALAYYNHVQMEGAPDDILDRYRDWIEDCRKLLATPQPVAPVAGAGAPVDPALAGGGPPMLPGGPEIPPLPPMAPPGNGGAMPPIPMAA